MKFQIVAIEREYATGGREIGELTAKRLGVSCYGGELLPMAAKQIGIEPENVGHMDEKAPGSLLYSLAALAAPVTLEDKNLSKGMLLRQKEAEIIWRLAEQESCVFIGRRAGSVLQKRQDVLRVFIHADKEFRLKRAKEEYQIPQKEAEAALKRFDHQRENYYNFYSGQKWNDPKAYHLVLDSGRLGVERCVRLIAAAME